MTFICFEFLGASSSPSLSRKGSLNLDRFNFSLSSADERYSISHGATGGSSKIPITSEVRSENQSLLGAVEPLDWLFSGRSFRHLLCLIRYFKRQIFHKLFFVTTSLIHLDGYMESVPYSQRRRIWLEHLGLYYLFL